MLTVFHTVLVEILYLFMWIPFLNEWYHIKNPDLVISWHLKNLKIASFKELQLESLDHLCPDPKPTLSPQEITYGRIGAWTTAISLLGILISDQKINFLLYGLVGLIQFPLQYYGMSKAKTLVVDGSICLALLLYIIYNHYAFHFLPE